MSIGTTYISVSVRYRNFSARPSKSRNKSSCNRFSRRTNCVPIAKNASRPSRSNGARSIPSCVKSSPKLSSATNIPTASPIPRKITTRSRVQTWNHSTADSIRPKTVWSYAAAASGRRSCKSIGALAEKLPRADRSATADFPAPRSEAYRFVERPDAVQSSLRVGRLLFTRTHPDFVGMQVIATVLGGYFGSRLMQNLRGEHGYSTAWVPPWSISSGRVTWESLPRSEPR
ncbi:MAG: insulinase family protein [Alistipes putredinis]